MAGQCDKLFDCESLVRKINDFIRNQMNLIQNGLIRFDNNLFSWSSSERLFQFRQVAHLNHTTKLILGTIDGFNLSLSLFSALFCVLISIDTSKLISLYLIGSLKSLSPFVASGSSARSSCNVILALKQASICQTLANTILARFYWAGEREREEIKRS